MFEWFGELFDPGPIGDLEGSPPPVRTRSAVVVYACGGVGAVLVLGAVSLALRSSRPLASLGRLAAYLALAYYVRPRPDYSNVGWLGGLVDHPLRWSDDANRFLAFLFCVLWPGRFSVASIRDAALRARDRGESSSDS